MNIVTKTLCSALTIALACAVPVAAGTPYSFNTINRTDEIVRVDVAMRTTVSLGSVNLRPGETYTLEVKGRPDLIEARSKHCNVSEPVPVPGAHNYRASVNLGSNGHCSLGIYAKG